MDGVNILQNLTLMIHSCKVDDKPITDLGNYLQHTVYPRLGSYAVFLDLINGLANDHSLRADEVTVEILEDYRQLVELVDLAEELL